MSTEAPADKPPRPRTVDYALYAILAKCALAVIFAVTLALNRAEVMNSWRTDGKHVGWSEQRLNDSFSFRLRLGVALAVVVSLIVLYLAKGIREGKNWSRMLFAALTILPVTPAADALQITYVFYGGPLLPRFLAVLLGLTSIMAVVLLFLPPSREYFRPAGTTRVSPFASFLRPRTTPGMRPDLPAQGAPEAPETGPAKRPSPRAKSRKASTE
jgi:hypothetical protein